MKVLGFAITICLYFSAFVTGSAQKVNYDALFGKWEYNNTKKDSKLTYELTLEKKFIAVMERNEKELKTEGDFKLDKKGDIDRLVLTTKVGTTGTQTPTTYYFIKFSGPDTLKLQLANDRQDYWRTETRKNTIVFIRKKEKAKADGK